MDDLNGLLRAVMKSALERMLDTEMDHHLGRRGEQPVPARNRRNGRSKKTVAGDRVSITPVKIEGAI